MFKKVLLSQGQFRPIIHLKELNSYIPYQTFKMETSHERSQGLSDLLHSKIDLKEAYYSIPLDKESQKNDLNMFDDLHRRFSCARDKKSKSYSDSDYPNLGQPWYPVMLEMLSNHPGFIPILYSSFPGEQITGSLVSEAPNIKGTIKYGTLSPIPKLS